MLNLLPEFSKNKLKSEYRGRRLVVILSFAIASLCIFCVFLLPSYIIDSIKQKSLVDQNAEIKAAISRKTGNMPSVSTNVSENLNILLAPKDSHNPTDLFSHVVKNKKPEISIVAISYGLDAESESVVMRGVAQTREDLVSFYKNLQADELFDNVELPISDIGPQRNNDFSIKLTIKIKKHEAAQ